MSCKHCRGNEDHHEHDHSHEHEETERKVIIARMIISTILLILAVIAKKVFEISGWKEVIIFVIPYFVIGYDVLLEAFENILHGKFFDENFLMALATLGALGLGEFPEAVFVMLFSQIGELFEDYAVDKSRDSIEELMDIRPDTASVERNGAVINVSPEDVAVGEVIVVRPGEKIPLDGVVIEGNSTVDTSALTGESLPRDISKDFEVISGCVNLTGLIKVKVTKVFGESTVSKILELVENESGKKAKSENFITHFARWYTPAVVIGAALYAVLPPLLIGAPWKECIRSALIFLVISCPCALVISVPMGFFAGLGSASKQGILIKGGKYMEFLSKISTAVFDKTGTLTKGTFSVTAVHTEVMEKIKLLELAALAESNSNHPISQSITAAWCRGAMTKEGALVFGCEITPLPRVIDVNRISSLEEIAGQGVKAIIDGKCIFCGNNKLMQSCGIEAHFCHREGTIVHMAINNEYVGHIVISDEVKEQSFSALTSLKKLGIKKTVMLTGDSEVVAKATAEAVGIDEYHAGLLPAEKVSCMEKLLVEKGDGIVAFAGDGINDAPVLTRADVGIAMGALGSDAAIEAADVVLMDDNPEKISTAILISRKTLSIVRQNIVFSLSVKVLVLILGILGVAMMWEAIFADVGVLVIAVLNSMRAGSIKK